MKKTIKIIALLVITNFFIQCGDDDKPVAPVVKTVVPFVLKSGEQILTANDIKSYTHKTNQLKGTGAEFKFDIINNTTKTLNYHAKMVEFTNIDPKANGVVFCVFGSCLNGEDMKTGQVLPDVSRAFTLNPGESMNYKDPEDSTLSSLKNFTAGLKAGDAKTIRVEFYATDAAGKKEGDSFTLTFEYKP